MKANSLMTRTLSGAVLVAVVVGMSLWRGWSFHLLWTLVGLLTLGEYARLLYTHRHREEGGCWPFWLIFGGLYIAQAFGLIQCLEPAMVVTLMVVVWMADTGAYLVGSAVGRHPMAPRISPKKTWEGFAGGLLFAVGAALAGYAMYWGGEFEANGGVRLWSAAAYDSPAVGALKWAGFGLAVGLAATVGDLIESRFKRTLGIKDSGNFIPGHGGMLDRFDALLLAVPVALGYIGLTGLLGD